MVSHYLCIQIDTWLQFFLTPSIYPLSFIYNLSIHLLCIYLPSLYNLSVYLIYHPSIIYYFLFVYHLSVTDHLSNVHVSAIYVLTSQLPTYFLSNFFPEPLTFTGANSLCKNVGTRLCDFLGFFSNIRCKKLLSSFPILFMLINCLSLVWDSLQFKGKAQSPIGCSLLLGLHVKQFPCSLRNLLAELHYFLYLILKVFPGNTN